MNYTLAQKTPTELTLDLTAPYADLEALFPIAAERIGANAEVEGFRKGKAPFAVIKQKFGEFKILEEAARIYIEKEFASILEDIEHREYKDSEKSFEPVGGPQISITKLAAGEDLEYKITLALLPAITLPDYRAIAAGVAKTRNVPPVAEEEVAKAIQLLRESRVKLVTVNRPAATGDRVEVDFSSQENGAPLANGSSKNHPLIIGEKKFLPGFEDQLLGMRAGEGKTFTIDVPKDSPASGLAGKTVAFAVTMRLVQEREVPAWDNAFAQSLGKFAGAEEAAASIRNGIRMEKEMRERERLRIAVVEAIAKEIRAEIPALLVERELEKMFAELKASVEAAGASFDNYLAHIKKTPEELAEDWHEDAKRRVIFALVLREIARREKIEPNDEEVMAAANRTASHRGLTDDDLKGIDHGQFLDYNRGIARNEKVFEFLEKINE